VPVQVNESGMTYLPAASISMSLTGRLNPGRFKAPASMGTMSEMKPFSITMSFGPDAGVPLPSMMMAFRTMSRG